MGNQRSQVQILSACNCHAVAQLGRALSMPDARIVITHEQIELRGAAHCSRGDQEAKGTRNHPSIDRRSDSIQQNSDSRSTVATEFINFSSNLNIPTILVYRLTVRQPHTPSHHRLRKHVACGAEHCNIGILQWLKFSLPRKPCWFESSERPVYHRLCTDIQATGRTEASGYFILNLKAAGSIPAMDRDKTRVM